MSRLNSRITSLGLLGIALAGLTVSSAAFATQPIHQSASVNKTAEGKCGEGKCGDARFNKTDANHDGRVSRAEFLKVVPNAAYFAQIDRDGDGYINEKEAYDNVKNAYEAHGKKIPAGLFAAIQKL